MAVLPAFSMLIGAPLSILRSLMAAPVRSKSQVPSFSCFTLLIAKRKWGAYFFFAS